MPGEEEVKKCKKTKGDKLKKIGIRQGSHREPSLTIKSIKSVAKYALKFGICQA